MKVADFALLKKMMNQTTSDNDNEALVALRAANRILAKTEGLTWDRVLSKVVQVEVPVEQAPAGSMDPSHGRMPKGAGDPEIERMLEYMMENSSGEFRNFIESLNEQWEDRKFLTPKQKTALMNSYDRARGGR